MGMTSSTPPPTPFDAVFNTLELERIPPAGNQPLRAWDAADEYIMAYLDEQGLLELPAKVRTALVINDAFGALSCGLMQQGYIKVVNWSDSYIAHEAMSQNIENNDLTGLIPEVYKSTQSINDIRPDMVLMKVPKTLDLLAYQLKELRKIVSPSTPIIASGMVKHLSRNSIGLFKQYIGDTHTSLAKKKARLIFAQLNKRLTPPNLASHPIHLEHPAFVFEGMANVFSKHRLDQGARLMLEQFPRLPKDAHAVLDLGCGNGVLGVVAQYYLPEAKVHFVDESYMAVSSAQLNYERAFEKPVVKPSYWESHVLNQVNVNGVDVVLCNPPFHQQHSISDQIAWQMIKQSHRVLNRGGQLWLVGNRHCGYHASLKKVFGNVSVLASDKKFVVLASTK